MGNDLRERRAQELVAWMRTSEVSSLRDSMRQLSEIRTGSKQHHDTPTLLIGQLKKLAESQESHSSQPIYCNLNCDLSFIFVPQDGR